jgi:hypothetical protein
LVSGEAYIVEEKAIGIPDTQSVPPHLEAKAKYSAMFSYECPALLHLN